MAVTYIGGHDETNFTPAYNQVNYYFDSDNKSEEGFRYVVDLYEFGTSNKVWEARIAPRASDGYAFIPLQGILSKLLTHETDITSQSIHASKSYFKFGLNIGEEFVKAWEYSDYEVYGNVGSFYNAYTQLRQFVEDVDTEHTYQVGDQILITQSDGGALKPILTGLHTIVEVVDEWTVVIELPFSAVGSGATVGGSTVFADNRKTIERDMITKSATVFNGALGHVEYLTLSGLGLVTTGLSTTKRLLSNLPTSGFRVTPTQIVKVNMANNFTTDGYYLYFRNDIGELFRKVTGASSSQAIRQLEVGATVTGLTTITGTAPLIKSSTTSYSFWIASIDSEPMSAEYKIQIDRRCAYNDTEMIFLDRKGSLASFAFQARNQVQTQVERNGYVKQLGDVDTEGQMWTYNTIDGGGYGYIRVTK